MAFLSTGLYNPMLCPSFSHILKVYLVFIYLNNGPDIALQIISIVKSRNTKDKTFGNLAFACGYVMLLVTSQVFVLHSVC